MPVIHGRTSCRSRGSRRGSGTSHAGRGRAQLTPDEVRGGTFTITNPGQYGTIMATPIINQPQVAILDLEAIVKRPVVVTDADGNDSIAIRPMTILGLSWDHRALDGALAAQFLATVKRGLEGCNRLTRVTDELWVCHLGTIEYRRGAGPPGAGARGPPGRRGARRPADARAPSRLHAGRRSARGRAADGRGLVPGAGDRVVEVDRGGQVTYHGPGQLVGYPIVRVDDVLEYVRSLERRDRGRAARGGPGRARDRPQDGPDYTGVWLEERKIASIGVHLSRGVTTHGWAVNVENDLRPFSWVVPCGLDGVAMTSLVKETGRAPGQMPCFRKRAAYQVARALDRRQRLVSPSRLQTAIGAVGAAA